MKVFLIGFMGCGKTTVGKKLAKKLSKTFIDLDKWIEQEVQMSVQEIFDRKGEEAFRALEKKYLRISINKDESVISTGGGTPCHSENMNFMNAEGITVYLSMKPEVLLHRLENSKTERPLLKGKTREETLLYIKNKLKEREDYYNNAHIIINAFNVDINELADRIRQNIQ